MTTLILVRHGQSEANRKEIFAGHYNAPLTERGHEQARLAAEYLTKNYKIDAVHSSDLLRAYHTGKPTADALGLPVVKETGMREIFEGEWSGRLFSDLRVEFEEDYGRWLRDIGHARCTGGESTWELLLRVKETLERIARENDGKTVLVTTHATPIRVMQTYVTTGSLDAMKDVPWVANASISELFYEDGKWRFGKISLEEHLGSLTTELPKNV